MPCYCDVPNESDQVEIQRRCKVGMYFDALGILNSYNLEKAKLLDVKITSTPVPDPNTALCNICKVLSKEQMQSITAFYHQIKWEYKSLWNWYQQHCKDDFEKNENNLLKL